MQTHTAAFKKVFSNRPFIGALLFALFLYIFEEWLFDFRQGIFLQYAVAFFSPQEKLIAFASSIGSFALCYFFAWAALKSSYFFQVFYVFLFTVSSLVQYGFWKAVERFLSAADLRIAAATPIDTWKGAGVLYFDWRFILPIIVFIFLLLLFSERQSFKPDLVKFGFVFLFLVVLIFCYTFAGDHINLGVSFSSFYQTITRFEIDNVMPPRRERIDSQQLNAPPNNIVLVIDESIRGDHLAINGYGRDTTPIFGRLAERENGFINFGLAVAGATCSYPSNALLLTGVRPGIDDFEMTMNYPTVFQYAKAMGYRTYYMDVQANSFWNGLTDSDVSFIDSWSKAIDFGDDIESDFRAADEIVKIISKGHGNFIVLNKRGVHFLYENSYPANAAVWLPLPGDYAQHPELISNPYDNGILYNVNTFFEHLLVDPGVLENTTILYTSDHGQTLFENQASWLHCNYTPQEATVPLVLIGDDLPAIDNMYPASHSNILPTLLDLMGVPPDQRAHSYAPSLFSGMEDTPDRFFLDGSLRLIDFPDP